MQTTLIYEMLVSGFVSGFFFEELKTVKKTQTKPTDKR